MERKHSFCFALAALAILGGSPDRAGAQWLTQTVTITNGWTAAYLFVDASTQNILPTTPGLPISPGNPIDKIWLWKVPPSTAQYITTPQSPLNGGGAWVSWDMTNSHNSLTALIPNAAYLIHSSGGGAYSWHIQGQPVPPHYTWDLTGLNFIGYSTPAVNPPNFQNYFSQYPAIADIIQIYDYVGGEFSTQLPFLNPAPVISLYYTPVNRGQAFWLSTSNVNNTYFGPFQVNLANPAGIPYGASGGQSTFHLVNNTPNPLTISMSLLPSETPPYGQQPIVAPPPLLLEGALNSSNLTYAYTALSGSGSPASWTLPPYGQPGSDVPVTLGVNRFAMSGTNGSLYAGVLRFTDSLGFSQVDVPVSASVSDDTGLWVGSANVNQVSYDLKTYATNSSGSYVSALVTNQLITFTTNSAATLGQATNLLISDTIVTNAVTDYYTITNQVIDTYSSNTTSIATNGIVLTTNLLATFGFVTNNDITTTVTGYYFTNNGMTLVWQTVETTNTTIVAAPVTTNLVLVTNLIATVPTNGTPVTVTNYQYLTFTFESVLITNDIFASPVTNVTSFVSLTLTNSDIETNLAYNGLATNVTTTISTTNEAPTVTSYSTATNIVSTALATNSFTGPYLFVFTNPPNLISVSVVTNVVYITNETTPVYASNGYVINNSYNVTSNATNLVGSTTNLVFTFTSNGPVVSTFAAATNLALAFTTNLYVVPVTNALVSSISNYVISAHNTNLDSVVAPYPLRLIVFSDANGNCSLLQRVYYGLRQDTNLVVATTEGVLDVSHLNVARRITATHLPWAATNVPWTFSGGSLAQGGTYSTTIREPYDDQASNPYLHTYHPDHNNLDTELTPHELPMGSESYEIDRTITLSLSANTNDFLSLTSANSVLNGNYYEAISLKGLAGYAKTYQTAGTFSLKRISTIPTLTTH